MDTLRLQARRLEHALDAKLVQLSQADSQKSPSCGCGGSQLDEPTYAATQQEIEALLAQLTQVNDGMRRRAGEESRL